MPARRFGVTIGADSNYLRMVHCAGGHRNPSRGIFLMTGIAYRAGGDMVSAATAGDGAVMTGKTITAKRRMVGHCGAGNIEPICGVMTSVALSRGNNVIRSLATRLQTVVTTGTSADGLCVIDRAGRHGLPIGAWRRAVTSDTFISRGNVWHRFSMAVFADTNDLRMVNRLWRHRCPGRRETLMTGIANRACRNVCAASSGGYRAIMATETISRRERGMVRHMGA